MVDTISQDVLVSAARITGQLETGTHYRSRQSDLNGSQVTRTGSVQEQCTVEI